jgi:hypothetical protein
MSRFCPVCFCVEGLVLGDSRPLTENAAPLQQPARCRSEAVLTLSGIQRGDPLNGASIRFRFGLLGGCIVKLFGPFEVEVLCSVSE